MSLGNKYDMCNCDVVQPGFEAIGYLSPEYIKLFRDNGIEVRYTTCRHTDGWRWCYVEPWVIELSKAYGAQPNFAGLSEVEFIIQAAGSR
jgi:hypothetical protein